jgi:hypothetical protein
MYISTHGTTSSIAVANCNNWSLVFVNTCSNQTSSKKSDTLGLKQIWDETGSHAHKFDNAQSILQIKNPKLLVKNSKPKKLEASSQPQQKLC